MSYRSTRTSATRTFALAVLAVLAVLTWSVAASAQLPPVPTPPQNPITEPKRVLGKILFWEEQLSSDDTVACGTCHRPAAAGADPRIARHPGPDGIAFTDDDIFGSEGVARRDVNGIPVNDPLFGFDPQVTGRTTPSFFTSQFAIDQFWDGRASSEFVDPESGATVIPNGGSLESQAIGPILNDVEMAHEGRTWDDVRSRLEAATPLALASNIPADMAAAIAADPTYPDLFEAAFGDPAIDAVRIAMAIATYERTLVADQTPFDLGTMTPPQQQGFAAFLGSPCSICHQPPFFTDHSFRNLGVRPIAEDIGRQAVTGAPPDAGRFKVPSLRNSGLKPTFMHNGQRVTLQQVLQFYRSPAEQFPGNVDPLLPVLLPPPVEADVIAFLSGALTDPRVANETFPFDRPTLGSELTTSVVLAETQPAAAGLLLHPAYPNPFNPYTTLSYDLDTRQHVRLSIYDVGGGLVTRLVDAPRDAGRHRVEWDGHDAAGGDVRSGVYFYRVEAGDEVISGRVVLNR